MEADVSLDTKGMKCPLPILKAKNALRDMATGDVLFVESTDPGSIADFKSFCDTTGHELLSSDSSDDVYTYCIKKY